ncbi:uncharacterized protein LOC143148553 [Ptiloglossa arizonensis]|uniref:uncharacterized protein LOC143148553 n=1 Tax=Ptiloglossa arizonensis TaxID=3350558 RepID=UPI003F9ED9FE
MGKRAPKMSARVVNAIRSLREAQGSTSKEIMNYVMTQYSAPESIIRRQMQAALKRGLDYGILKKNHGHYFLDPDADVPRLTRMEPTEKSKRRSRRRRRRSGRSKSRRRRSKRRRGRRRTRGRRKSRRRRPGSKRRAARSGRVGCTNCRCTKKTTKDAQALDGAQTDQQLHEEDVCGCDKENDTDRRSRERSLSRSRSSANSDRDAAMDDRREIHDQD